MNKQFCGNCGRRNETNSVFCEGCGNNLEQGNLLTLNNQPAMALNQPNQQASSYTDSLFNSYSDEPTNKVDTTVNNIIVGFCCFLSIFFGGLLSVLIAGIIYLPFRNRNNGWIFFVIGYVISAFLLVITFSR